MIPSGVLIVDLITKEAAYANQELERLMSPILSKGLSLKEGLSSFQQHVLGNSNKCQGMNLWDYLLAAKESERLFKSKKPKRYLEVKVQLIN